MLLNPRSRISIETLVRLCVCKAIHSAVMLPTVAVPEGVRRHAIQALGALAPRQAEVQQVVVDHRQQVAAKGQRSMSGDALRWANGLKDIIADRNVAAVWLQQPVLGHRRQAAAPASPAGGSLQCSSAGQKKDRRAASSRCDVLCGGAQGISRSVSTDCWALKTVQEQAVTHLVSSTPVAPVIVRNVVD